jgi:tRNA (cmo5U34)-methyltransferase
MVKKINVGTRIKSIGTGGFSFTGKTTKYFDTHISKSIPFFLESHKLISKLSTFFVSNESTVYDLGCSTGLSLRAIADHNLNKRFKIVGIDLSKDMINKAKINTNKKKYNKIKINYLCNDVLKIKLDKSDLIISNYFIQFIHPKKRQKIFDKIYNSLNYGGGFIFFEKTRGPDARFQDMFTQLYNDYKSDSGFTEKEILNKTKSIRGYLEPFTEKANIDFLKRAGFKDYTTVFKYYSFQGFLAIK